MSRNKLHRPFPTGFVVIPRSRRGWCFGVTSVYIAAMILWVLASQVDALAGMTTQQCTFLLDEFKKTFVQTGDGYPSIESCDTRIVGLMWQQQINRVYSTDNTRIETYDQLRTLPDKLFAKLVVNAAAGSLLDSTQTASDDIVVRIRVNKHGHFNRYVLNDTSRITALQTMLVLSIVTLAVTWWRLASNHDVCKSV
jgi:hypothetical protein